MKSLLYTIVTLLLIAMLPLPSHAQKILQMERYGSLKSKRYYIGDVITYQLEGERKNWREDEIIDLDLENKLIIFSKGAVKIQDIRYLRPNNVKAKGKAWSSKLYLFSASYMFWAGVTYFRGSPISWETFIMPVAAVITGFVVEKIIRAKRYKLGKRRWLRILDLTMQKPVWEGA